VVRLNAAVPPVAGVPLAPDIVTEPVDDPAVKSDALTPPAVYSCQYNIVPFETYSVLILNDTVLFVVSLIDVLFSVMLYVGVGVNEVSLTFTVVDACVVPDGN
jgi:hypothetical protein